MYNNTILLEDAKRVMENLPNESFDSIITDPPYGINYISKQPRLGGLEGDKKVDTSLVTEMHRLLKENSSLFLFTRWDVYNEWYEAVVRAGFKVRNMIVWNKKYGGTGDLKGSFAPAHELIIYATKGEVEIRDGRDPDVYTLQRINGIDLRHPTEKPEKIIRWLIKKSTKKGDWVFDPYAGSGTTVVCCKQLQRNSIGVEIDEKWHKVGIERLKQKSLKWEW